MINNETYDILLKKCHKLDNNFSTGMILEALEQLVKDYKENISYEEDNDK